MKIRLIIIILSLLAFATASVGGYVYYSSMKVSAIEELHRDADARLLETANRIDLYLLEYQKIAAVLAGLKEARQVFAVRRSASLSDANRVLDHFQKAFGVDVCYLIDRSGNTIASSNRNASDSFVGKNYAFRPYFKEAAEGRPAIYMALGVTSKKRGVFYSHPVYYPHNQSVAGVVVIKASIDLINREIREKYDGVVALVDPRGVVFVSNRPDLRYHVLWKAALHDLSEIAASQQFGPGPFTWAGIETVDENTAADTEGKRYRIHRAPIKKYPGWEIVYLHDIAIASKRAIEPMFPYLGVFILTLCLVIGAASYVLYRSASIEIVKRKQAEIELQHISDRLRAMIKASPLAVMILDMNGNVELWNPAAEEMFGWKEQEVLGRPLRIVPADRQQEYLAFLKMVFNGKSFKSVDTQRLRKDGSLIDVALSTAPLHDAQGAVIAAMGVFEDISDRKKTEEDLRFQASIIQNLPDAVCGIDLNGITVAWNAGAERMLGYRAIEIIGKPITTVIPEDIAQKELEHCITILRTDGVLAGYESVRVAKDDRRVPVEITGVAIRDKSQNIVNYASIMVDITDRKKAEEERLKSHMLESIGILAAGIAHDFNNLLNVIVGDIHIAKKSLTEDEKAFGRLSDAEQICEMAGDLSKRLITFATGGDPVRRSTPISGLLIKTVIDVLKSSTVRAVFDLPEDLSPISVDEGQMKQVFNNLVVNATEAMPKGGVLAIAGENVRISAQDNMPMREGSYVRLSFRDTGPGIPSDKLAKIFDPYYSTKDTFSQKGLGLGLAVCYSVIKRHDGLITAESEVGRGTTFIIYLPAANKPKGGAV